MAILGGPIQPVTVVNSGPVMGGASQPVLVVDSSGNALLTSRQLFANVKDSGAAGDGATDDTAAINSAISAVNAAGGGVVFFPAGTYLTTGGHVIYSNIHYMGAGPNATIIKLKDNTNGGAHVFAADQFAARTGTQINTAVHSFVIDKLAINGNAANNAGAGFGLALYAFDYILRDVHVYQCAGRAIHSEWNPTSSAAPNALGVGPSDLPCWWDNIRVFNSGNATYPEQVYFAGPHDSLINCVSIFNNAGFVAGGVGLRIVDSGLASGFNSATACQFSKLHIYQNNVYALKVECGYCQFTDCQFESAGNSPTADGAQVYVSSGNAAFYNCRLFGVSNGRVQNGMELTSGATGTIYNGSMNDFHTCVKFTGAAAASRIDCNVYAGLPNTTTLNGGIDNVTTTVVATSNSNFPPTTHRIQIDSEQMDVTAKSGGGNVTWTVTRGVNGTSAASHSNGATITGLWAIYSGNPSSLNWLNFTGGNSAVQDLSLLQSRFPSHIGSASSSAPTIGSSSGAGTGPTVSLSGASDNAGLINVTTGTSPSANANVVTVTFGTPSPYNPRAVILMPANAATANIANQPYVFNTSRSFTVAVGTTALPASTALKWYYWCVW